MNSFSSLLFPDTSITRETRYPLLLLCSPLHYLNIIESAPADSADRTPDSFIKSGLCQAHTPAPLAGNRERFLRLVHDISQRTDDYASQLSNLTVASMSASRHEKNKEASHEIVSSLLKGHDVDAPSEDQSEVELWQARLVLAIAEILEEKEEEVRQNLLFLDVQEIEMLRSLQGEDDPDADDPFADLERIKAQLEIPRPREFKLRFQAWLRLMLNRELPAVDCWLASSPDAADQIFNEYEKQSDIVAPPVLKLAIPERISSSPPYAAEQISSFRQAGAQAIEEITGPLTALCRTVHRQSAPLETLLPLTANCLERWDQLLDDHFPAGSHGRKTLTFYLLPEQPPTRLLRLKKSSAAVNDTLHGLLAVLGP